MRWRRKRWRHLPRHAAGEHRNEPVDRAVAPAVSEETTPEPRGRHEPAESLFEVLEEPATDAPVLVHALSGFMEAGSARRIAVDHLLATLPHRTIATYDIDGLYDYRARRPRMVFDSDHFVSVDLPELVVTEMTDAAGTRFLLLHGPEPDLGWQAFTRSLLELVDRLNVRLTVGLNAIPWASPHTRPIGVSAHATTPDLVMGRPSWVGTIEVPGHLGAMLEVELGKAGKPAMGFAVHVPHYLVNGEHPRSALTMLEQVANATGLALPTASLATAADQADAALDAQVAENPENVQAIKMLEAQYDAVIGAPSGPGLAATSTPLPSGDEIAAQLEEFLRDLGDTTPPDA